MGHPGQVSSSSQANRQRQAAIHSHTGGQFGVTNAPQIRVFVPFEETGEPEKNPSRHGEKESTRRSTWPNEDLKLGPLIYFNFPWSLQNPDLWEQEAIAFHRGDRGYLPQWFLRLHHLKLWWLFHQTWWLFWWSFGRYQSIITVNNTNGKHKCPLCLN